ISPDGALNLMPFEALADERGRYLVERYSISYLASGRDLLRLEVARESKSGPLVVADPDFGDQHQVETRRSLKQKKATPEQAGEKSPAPVFSKFYFPALPYTAKEGEALRALLPGATLLTKRQASKMAIRKINSPELLHIATHGFFLEDFESNSIGGRNSRTPTGRRLKQVEKSEAHIESPLLRSGLALAGANERNQEDNGIPTALQVTGLHISRT